MNYFILQNKEQCFGPCEYSAEFIGELIAKSPENQQFTIAVLKSDADDSPLCTVIVDSVPSFNVDFTVIDGNKRTKGYVSRLSITRMFKEIESVVRGKKLEYLHLYES